MTEFAMYARLAGMAQPTSITIGFRLTPDEYEQLEKVARHLPALGRGVSVGDAARAIVLAALRKTPKEIAAGLVRLRTK